METPLPPKFNFSQIKHALLDNTQPFPATKLYFFSDISQDDLTQLKKVWPEVRTERRRGLLEDMETLSEKDTLLFFDPVAIMSLTDEDPVARATAVRLLWQSQKESLVPRFLKLMNEDPESIVRAAAATALGLFVYLGELEEIKTTTYEKVVESLIQTHLSADDRLVRRRALESLGYASQPEISEFIQRAYETNDEEWLQSALFAMGRSCNPAYHEAVTRMFDHPDTLVCYEAIRAAGELEIKDAREMIFDLLEEGTDDEDLYFAAIWALTKIGGDGVRDLIEMSLEETDDPDEILFLEEALENLNFTEQTNLFDMLIIDEDDPDIWEGDEEDLLF